MKRRGDLHIGRVLLTLDGDALDAEAAVTASFSTPPPSASKSRSVSPPIQAP